MSKDFRIISAGLNLDLLIPVSDEAKEFVKERVAVPDYATYRSVPVEPRYMGDIVNGILDEGMTIGT